MPSNINYASINENFPVAGQDNDTQVFRDNFDTIKNSLSTAKTEVADLLDNAARKDEDNDFGENRIVNATFRNVKGLKYSPAGVITASEGQSSTNTEINFLNGMYQIYRFGTNAVINFQEFSLTNYSKLTLEIYGDGNARTLTFATSGGTVIKKNSSNSWGGSSSLPTLTVTSAIDPIILEVWQHDSNKLFLNFMGQFN